MWHYLKEEILFYKIFVTIHQIIKPATHNQASLCVGRQGRLINKSINQQIMNDRMYIGANQKMSDVVFDNPRIILLLENLGISFPLQERTIFEACKDANLNPEVFLTFANLYNGIVSSAPSHFTFLETQPIIQFLKRSHNYYLQEKFPDIRQNLIKMYEVNHESGMNMVEQFFNEYLKEVVEHLKYEDEVVFPYITSLHQHIKQHKPFIEPVAYSMNEYREHHNDIEEKLTDLNNLLVKYLPGKNDQMIRRKLFLSLSELEFDLNIHAKIEDMILIPLVEKMEFDLKSIR
jgi:regulator of cell morphogenesis and NO signaling